ncbi:MAG: hypothetical protein PVG99_08425 [Desulfobacteraceae bacterium]|jgi:glyoxylase-like metal-dependent hydrolase (beta-lactamase superfamily II)
MCYQIYPLNTGYLLADDAKQNEHRLGHSPGHQSMMVQTHAGPYILAGDAAWYDPEKGLSPPRKAAHPEDAKQSFHDLLKPEIPILASHDPSVVTHDVFG